MKEKLVCFESVKPLNFSEFGEFHFGDHSQNKLLIEQHANNHFGVGNWLWISTDSLAGGYASEKIHGRCLGFAPEFYPSYQEFKNKS